MYESPVEGGGVDVVCFTALGGGIRRLRDLARDVLLIEDAILWEGNYSNTKVTWYFAWMSWCASGDGLKAQRVVVCFASVNKA